MCCSPWECKELGMDTTERLAISNNKGKCCEGKHQIWDVFCIESKEDGCEA